MIWLVLSLILLVAAAEYWSLTKLPRYIDTESSLRQRTAEPGTPFTLRTVFRNHSRLPVTMLSVTESIPPAAQPEIPESGNTGARLEKDVTGGRLSYKTWLLPRQQLVKDIRFSIPKRGCYIFRGSSVFVGDFTGLKGTVRIFERHEEIVIYPEALEETELSGILGGYLGEIPVRRFILEDPVLTAGLMEYTGREPMRAINWKQSARSLKTMVNQYDHTTDFSAAVVLNLSYAARYQTDRALLERTLSLARSVIEALEQRRIRYSFFSNMLTAGSIGGWLYVPEGLGTAHKNGILEGLGRSTLDVAETPQRLFERVIRMGDRDSCCILITPDPADSANNGYMEEIRQMTGRIRDRYGYPVLVLFTGEKGVRRWS